MKKSLLRTDKEISKLYETYADMVYRLCITLLKNPFDAEDAVQNTFLKLIHSRKSFEGPEHEKAWLIVTATNTCKDTLRRASRRDAVGCMVNAGTRPELRPCHSRCPGCGAFTPSEISDTRLPVLLRRLFRGGDRGTPS